MIIVDATYNRRVVRAPVGEVLRLELPENVATGNRWALPDPLPRQLRLVTDKTQREPNVSYAAGERRLEFRIVSVGSFALCLLDTPSWHQAPASFDLLIEAYEMESDAQAGPASSPL